MNNMPYKVEYSLKITILRDREALGIEWQKSIIDFLKKIADECKEVGVLAIGHIKGQLSFRLPNSRCKFLYKEKKDEIHCKGQIDDFLREGYLEINILVYGSELYEIENIVDEGIEALEFAFKSKCYLSQVS